MNDETDKLLPCPFCGGEAVKHQANVWPAIGCSNDDCHIEMLWKGSKKTVGVDFPKVWSTRINDQWVSVEDACKGKPYQSYLVWRTGDGENYHAAVDYTIDDNWSFSENYDVVKVQLITPPKDND